MAVDEEIIRVIVNVLYFLFLYVSIYWLSIILDHYVPNTRKKRRVWPEVAIILPIFNEEKSIEATIESVYALNYPKKKLKVYCVNDGSTDNSLKILKKLNKKYDYTIISQKNQGKHVALNTALKKIDSPFFSCLDADSFVEKDALRNIIEEFDDPEIASVMPIMKVHQPKNLIQRLQWFEYIISVFQKYIMGKIDCIHVVPGPFGTYRTEIVKKEGSFKRAHMTEDLEMALRLQNKHYKLKQCMEAFVYTKSPPNVKSLIKQRTRWYHGTILNIKDYRHFLFNKNYGDFGMFHIPIVGLGGFLLFIGVFSALYLFFKGIYEMVRSWYLTNFDFRTYIESYTFEIALLDYNWQNIFALTALLFILYVLIYLAFHSNKENVSIFRNFKYILMFLYYFIFYRFVIAYIWLIIISRLIFKKTNKWDKVN